MIKIPHELKEEFPDHAALLDELQRGDDRFAKLCEEYDRVNDAVGRMESGIEPVADHVERDMRKRRLALKDDIAAFLRNASRASRPSPDPKGV